MIGKFKHHDGYSRLKGALREKGYSYHRAAEALGVSDASLCQKINGGSDFFVQEALALAALTGRELTDLFPVPTGEGML